MCAPPMREKQSREAPSSSPAQLPLSGRVRSARRRPRRGHRRREQVGRGATRQRLEQQVQVASLVAAFVARDSRWSRGLVAPSARCVASVWTTKGIVTADDRPRMNAATRLAEGASPDHASGGHDRTVAAPLQVR